VPGPIALVGSGEYLPAMAELETSLLTGRPPRYVQLPTAAAEEGSDSVDRWVSLGQQQAQRLGVEAVPVLALDRPSADDPVMAQRVSGAGLVYLSGGSPAYLAATLRGTRVWAAILEEWRRGAALAGCSAGAMALTSRVPDIRHPRRESHQGLGVVPNLQVLPHFDRLRRWMPWMPGSVAAQVPPDTVLVGIDEETAIVSDGLDLSRWTVRGRRSAWVINRDGRQGFADGQELLIAA